MILHILKKFSFPINNETFLLLTPIRETVVEKDLY